MDTGYRILDTGDRILDTGDRIQDTGYRILDNGYCKQIYRTVPDKKWFTSVFSIWLQNPVPCFQYIVSCILYPTYCSNYFVSTM